ncbi:MAG: pilus assembly protein [Burkholderiales bacterium]|nr:pilus assembly protein [Burkholderiales bacterium]MDE2394706.1 pilus assembly protein [Burkholderiales bacterium]MDE2452651.1 pilus assembly protein [Burkholderiales bacterium]
MKSLPYRPTRERGFVLITGLIFLVVLTLLGLALFRSGGMQERIAGNTREKQRALEAAESALQYGEWWVSEQNRGTGTPCTAVTNGNVVANMKVCSNALANPTSLPWPAYASYQPPTMTVSTAGGLAANGDINYQAKPGVYISYLGLDSTGKAQLYQVTAFGQGGSASTAAVVQSTYKMASAVKDLGGN